MPLLAFASWWLVCLTEISQYCFLLHSWDWLGSSKCIHTHTHTHTHTRTHTRTHIFMQVSQVVLGVKNLPANAGDIRDVGLIPGLERSPEGGNIFQHSCLENPMDREEPGGLQSLRLQTVRQNWRQLSTCMHMHTHTHTHKYTHT